MRVSSSRSRTYFHSLSWTAAHLSLFSFNRPIMIGLSVSLALSVANNLLRFQSMISVCLWLGCVITSGLARASLLSIICPCAKSMSFTAMNSVAGLRNCLPSGTRDVQVCRLLQAAAWRHGLCECPGRSGERTLERRRHTHTHTHTTERARGRRTDGRTDGRTYGRTDGRTDGPTDRRTDRRTDRQTDGQTDRQTESLQGDAMPRVAALFRPIELSGA